MDYLQGGGCVVELAKYERDVVVRFFDPNWSVVLTPSDAKELARRLNKAADDALRPFSAKRCES